MANNEKIDELISPKALEQFDKLLTSLDIGSDKMASLVTEADKFNKAISGSKSLSEFAENTKKANAEIEKTQKQLEKTRLDEIRLQQAREKAFDDYEKKLQKQLATEAKAEAALAKKNKVVQSEIVLEVDKAVKIDASTTAINKQNEATNKAASEAAAYVSNNQKVVSSVEKSTVAYSDAEKELLRNIKTSFELSVAISEITNQQKINKTSFDNGKISADKYTESNSILQLELNALKTSQQELNLEIRRQSKEINSAESSYNSISSKLDSLRAAYKNLTQEERDNIEVGGTIIDTIKEYDKQLKALDKSMGVNNRNVGDYAIATENLKNSLLDLIPGANGVNEAFEKGQSIFNSLKTILSEYIAGSAAASASTNTLSGSQKAAFISSELLSKGMRILRLALISTGIGAIVVLLGSLITYLTQTQEGIDKVTAVTRPLQAIFKNMITVLGDLGKKLFDAFSNPKQLLKDLGDLLISQVINRFKALGVILDGLINFDLNKVSDGLFQAATGVENLTGKIQNAASATGKFLSDSIKQGQEIDRLTKQIEQSEINTISSVAKLSEEFKKQNDVAEDITKTFSERASAAKKSIDIQKQINNLQNKQLNDEITLKNKIEDLNGRTRSGDKEIAELEKKRTDLARTALEAETTQRNKLNQINKQAAEEARKALDARIGYEKQSYDILAGIALETVNDDKVNQQTRIENLELYLQYAEKSLIKERDLALNADNITAIQRKTIQAKFIEDKRKLDQKGLEESLKIFEQSYTAEQKARSDANKKAINDLTIQRDEELALVVGTGKTLSQQKENSAEKELEINRFYNRLIIEEEIKQTELLIEQAKLRGENVSDQEARIAALKLKLSKETTEAQIKDADKLEERQKRFNEFAKESAFEVADIIGSLVNSAAQSRLDALDKEAEKIQSNYDFEKEQIEESLISEEEKNVKLAQLDADRAAQEEQIEQRKREIQVSQARFAKAMAIAEIAYNTGAAIMGIWAQVPKFDFGISAGILTGVVSALGAAQIATVLATPVPGYYTGVESSPEGLAYVGERGREGRINPDGSFELTPSKSTLTYLEKGTQIIPHNELNMMLANANIDPVSPSMTMDFSRLEEAINKGSKQTIKAIKSNKSTGTVITKSGWRQTQKKNAGWTKYIGRNIN